MTGREEIPEIYRLLRDMTRGLGPKKALARLQRAREALDRVEQRAAARAQRGVLRQSIEGWLFCSEHPDLASNEEELSKRFPEIILPSVEHGRPKLTPPQRAAVRSLAGKSRLQRYDVEVFDRGYSGTYTRSWARVDQVALWFEFEETEPGVDKLLLRASLPPEADAPRAWFSLLKPGSDDGAPPTKFDQAALKKVGAAVGSDLPAPILGAFFCLLMTGEAWSHARVATWMATGQSPREQGL